MAVKNITIRGAREHNLKNVDLDIPKNKLVVITGVSGSGKSSLAFDTIYAEGQRRYVESLSVYARQFLDMQSKPEVDFISGLSPAIAIEQKTTSKNPRSTVGTITEIYDYMRLLWARVGVPYSPITGLPIKAQTIADMVNTAMNLPKGTNVLILAPSIIQRKGEFKKELLFLAKQGYQRVIIDDEIYKLDEVSTLDKNKKHSISVVIDRITLSDDSNERLYASFEASLRLVKSVSVLKRLDTNEEILFSQDFACPVSGFSVPKIEPRLFSFNSPLGACSECDGLGFRLKISPDLVIPDENLSIRSGAIAPWSRNGILTQNEHLIEAVAKQYKIPMNKPWKSLTNEMKDLILYGTGDNEVKINWNGYSYSKPFEGVIPNLERRYRETESNWAKEDLSKYQISDICPVCHGKRLNIKALAVKIDGFDISDATSLSVDNLIKWIKSLENKLSAKDKEISSVIVREIQQRLKFLQNVGLGYLTIDRISGTLSGGESQRIRLASQIGSGLTGVLYVLDEPSIGLHQRDNDKLIGTLKDLRDKDNTVIVVEHDEDTMKAADYLIDVGLGAGVNGGNIIAAGTPDDVEQNKDSLTGRYLAGETFIETPKSRRNGNGKKITIKGACQHNLKNIDLDIPLGKFVCITGVSGSGKSSLILNTLYPAIMKSLYHSRIPVGKYKSIEGLNNIDKIIDIDQSPIGRTPRSNPATYTGVFTAIRDFYASLPEAKARGYDAGRFSFNVSGGRCEACQGDGVIKIEMHFLPDVYVACEKCKGQRYNEETLKVKYKDKSIADVLNMTVEEAYKFFFNIPTIKNKLEFLMRVGLSYIALGQSSLTLSGGEAQRIKLSKELSRASTGRTLYVLDEPTTGLHFVDIKLLLNVLQELVDNGNSVLVIEHNMDVIKSSDYVIDLGPEGGECGGEIVATGTPEEVAKNPKSYTGKYLKNYLKK